MDRKKVGIVIFPMVEVLDFCGPFEVFSVTRLTEGLNPGDPSPFEVLLVAETAAAVTTTGGMQVAPHTTFDACPPLDIMVVPGGWGARAEMKNPAMLDFVKQQAAGVETLTSVCTGSLVLGNAGLLDGLRATTHWRSLGMMQEKFPRITVDRESHVVEDGRVWSRTGACSPPRASPPASTWRSRWSRATMERRSRARPRATWSIRIRIRTSGGWRYKKFA